MIWAYIYLALAGAFIPLCGLGRMHWKLSTVVRYTDHRHINLFLFPFLPTGVHCTAMTHLSGNNNTKYIGCLRDFDRLW